MNCWPASQDFRFLSRRLRLPSRRTFSSQCLRCKIRRHDMEDGGLAVIFALAVLSFHDARPRGNSHVDYVEEDSDPCPLRPWTSGH